MASLANPPKFNVVESAQGRSFASARRPKLAAGGKLRLMRPNRTLRPAGRGGLRSLASDDLAPITAALHNRA